MATRNFSAYELNQLQKYDLDPAEFEETDSPVEYLTNHAEFCGHDLYIDERVLIPRPETEKLVQLGISWVTEKKFNKKFVFADIGTGSGAIGVSFAHELVQKKIPFNAYFTDIFRENLELANENTTAILGNLVEKNNSRISFIESNLLTELNPSVRFDLIFANLPYIPSDRIQQLEESVREFEPLAALDGGEDGLTLILQLLEQAERRLKKSGVLLLEVDDTHDEAFINKNYAELRKYWKVEVLEDEKGKTRYWVCKRAR